MNPDKRADSGATRRAFVGAAAASGLAIGGLAACNSGDDDGGGGPSEQSERKPRRGGNLRVAIAGAGTAETFEPGKALQYISYLNCFSVFDPLLRVAGYETQPGLAVGWESNADATVWEIELRDGVTWHDGKPFGPRDVIYTFRSFGDPGNMNTVLKAAIRLDELKPVGKNKVRVPLRYPFAQFKEQFLGNWNALIIQEGAKNFDKPVGTGPFKLRSWTPGRRSVLDANRDYWDEGKPYADQLEIIVIDDETARLNALQAGEADIISDLSYATAKAGGGGRYQVVLGAPGLNRTFYMRVDRPPFDDVRVRTAMKLIADRPALIKAAFSGLAEPGNDIWGIPRLEYYNKELPQREQDIEQAKSLLKAAGQPDLRVSLVTSSAVAGFVEAATAYAQQCKEAGVTAKVERVQPAAFYDPAQGYLSRTFGMTEWGAGPSITAIYGFNMLPDSPTNETHVNLPELDRAYRAASAETDKGKAQELWNEVQKVMWEESGYLVWARTRSSDAAANNVAGFSAGGGTGWFAGLDEFRVFDWGFAD